MFETRLRRILRETDRVRATAECPEAELFAGYLDHKLSAADHARVTEHLADCPSCLEQAVMALEIGDGALVGDLLEQVDVVVRYLRDTVELIRGREDIHVVPVAIFSGARGRKIPAPHTARFIKEFEEVSAEVEVERFREGAGEIRVKTSRDGHLLDRIRVTLIHGNKEVASYLTESGRVLFEDVRFGRYALRFRKNGVFIGDISLHIREEI